MDRVARFAAGVALAMALLGPSSGWAQGSYPDRPIKIVVPYTPGGTVDVLARALGQQLSEAWKQGVVIENKPGAGGNLGTEQVAKSPPDGYTLLMSTNTPLTTNLALYKSSIRYDTLRDFDSVTVFADSGIFMLALPTSPTKTVAQVIELAKQKPDGLTMASSGFGTLGHFIATGLSKVTGGKITHVPHRGGVPALTAVLTGEVNYAVVDTGAAAPFIKDGRLIGLGVSGTRTAPGFPDIPPFSEVAMPNNTITVWVPVMAPKGTPRPILEKLNNEFQRIIKDPKFRQTMLNIGLNPLEDLGAAKMDEFIRAEVPRWKQIVEESGLEIK